MQLMAGEEGRRAALRSREEADRLVLDIVAHHADSLLRVARRHSLCHDDAHDAYQRSLEILLRHAPRLDSDRAYKYAHTIVKHEAMRVRAVRSRTVTGEEIDLDRHAASTVAPPDEHVLASDRLARSTEALQRLKPQELRALWLKAPRVISTRFRPGPAGPGRNANRLSPKKPGPCDQQESESTPRPSRGGRKPVDSAQVVFGPS